MRIGITQRVELANLSKEFRDCLDQNWVLLLEAVGHIAIPIPNGLKNVTSWADQLDIQGVIFSGGNDLTSLPDAVNASPRRDHTELVLLDWAKQRGVPCLGVCRGAQIINYSLGGTLLRASGHVGKRHSVLSAKNCISPFDQVSEVNSYHNWCLPACGLAPALEPQIYSADGFVEAFILHDLRWYGIMWHPEREVPFRDSDFQLLHSIFTEQ